MNTKTNHSASNQESKWQLKIGSQLHGPYSVNQMRSLVLQGMLSPHSQISPAGADQWRAACDEPDIAGFFRGSQNKFSQRSAAPACSSPETKPENTNFILSIDIKAETNNDLEQTIMRLGRATHVMRNVWILRGAYTVGTLRNALIPYLRPMDSLFIVDANHGTTAWFNLGLEAESRISQIWKEDD